MTIELTPICKTQLAPNGLYAYRDVQRDGNWAIVRFMYAWEQDARMMYQFAVFRESCDGIWRWKSASMDDKMLDSGDYLFPLCAGNFGSIVEVRYDHLYWGLFPDMVPNHVINYYWGGK